MNLEVLIGEHKKNGIVKTILQMQPMPSGCYAVSKTEATPESPAMINELAPILFFAVFECENYARPIECYGIQEVDAYGIVWRTSQEVNVYAYGPYKETCDLLGKSPMRFADWYEAQQKGEPVFEIHLRSIES